MSRVAGGRREREFLLVEWNGKKKHELKWATQSTFSLLDAFDRGRKQDRWRQTHRKSPLSASERTISTRFTHSNIVYIISRISCIKLNRTFTVCVGDYWQRGETGGKLRREGVG